MPFLFDRFLNNKQGIVNVRMVITEEKILSNIEKVQKMINPNSKKQIVQLEEDTYFKDLVESIKTYLEEYPKKKNFPRSVYNAAYDLVEFATNQFEENTKKIEELIIQREKNIGLAFELKTALSKVIKKEEGFEKELELSSAKFSEDINEALKIISGKASIEEKKSARKLIDARITNLESNFHIEIDMERIEDKSKALSYIGIEVADALKVIPSPTEEGNGVDVEEATVEEMGIATEVKANTETVEQSTNVAAATTTGDITAGEQTSATEELQAYQDETTVEAKPTLWQKIKGSKLVKALTFITRIKIKIEVPSNALPEGRGEN